MVAHGVDSPHDLQLPKPEGWPGDPLLINLEAADSFEADLASASAYTGGRRISGDKHTAKLFTQNNTRINGLDKIAVSSEHLYQLRCFRAETPYLEYIIGQMVSNLTKQEVPHPQRSIYALAGHPLSR